MPLACNTAFFSLILSNTAISSSCPNLFNFINIPTFGFIYIHLLPIRTPQTTHRTNTTQQIIHTLRQPICSRIISSRRLLLTSTLVYVLTWKSPDSWISGLRILEQQSVERLTKIREIGNSNIILREWTYWDRRILSAMTSDMLCHLIGSENL